MTDTMLQAVVDVQTWLDDRRVRIAEHGATSVEYALMIALIAISIITAVAALRDKVRGTFNLVANTIPS